jgi:hypothetical protein
VSAAGCTRSSKAHCLRPTAELRAELTDEEVADIVLSMNAAEYRALLVGERGWSADAWTRMLLA